MDRTRRLVEAVGRTEHEFLREKAAALTRIATKLEILIDRLEAVRRVMEHATGDERERQREICRDLRAEARRYRWYLEVQRESVGLFRHERLDEIYRIPEDP
jgi:hypothetical protein